MKRLFFMAIAIFCMTTTIASNAKVITKQAYDMNYNVRQLGCCLGLTLEQLKDVDAEHAKFMNEMKDASNASESDKTLAVRKAVNEDFRIMKGLLTPTQYAKYQLLMNTTYQNRGIDEFLK
jgi:hypothetical protein